MKEFFEDNRFVLAEAAIIERLRRRGDIKLDDALVHSMLIYDDVGRKALSSIYEEYIGISAEYDVPILLSTPTWRANQKRVTECGAVLSINRDNVAFLKNLIREHNAEANVKVGGLIGCANDCYLPEEALDTNMAVDFHMWQIEELGRAGVDFLEAVTLPSVKEAKGITLAMSHVNIPYILSFVIGSDGNILDGTRLEDAFAEIDSLTGEPPLGYFVNCSYPTFLNLQRQSSPILRRLLGVQANASSLEHHELDGACELQQEPLDEWGNLMIALHRDYNVKVLGGCCGTTGENLRYLAKNIS